MKLRNKNTGEIVEYDSIGFRKGLSDGWEGFIAKANSLAELNENFEDYEQKEPLIKDEKVRKAVRAWLSIQEQPIVEIAITCKKDGDGFFNYHLYGYIEFARIIDGKAVENKNLIASSFEFRRLEEIDFERNKDYTIAELCGEEEYGRDN